MSSCLFEISIGILFINTSVTLAIVNCCKNLNNSTILVFPLPFSPYIAIKLFVLFFVLFKLNSISLKDLKFLAFA